jgi:flavin reductase (DIM6/NTAB) family NADH-FMN oxidoreductase RutF
MTPLGQGLRAFEGLMSHLDYPMFVVTTSVGHERSGCLVGFATQASIDPPRFLVGLSDKNHTFRVAERASHLAVHVLHRDDKDIARLFGEQTGDDTDKFRHCAWHEGPHGLPILDGAAAWFSGQVLQRTRLGDHVAFLLEAEDGEASRDLGWLLTFADVGDLHAGHEA